jgi:RNA 2',3'-cyclic 3'-phosphodiesterase
MSDDLDKNNKNHRVFFALWPDDDTRKKIIQTFEQSSIEKGQGRIVHPDNLHITLHFIGNVNQKKLNCLHKAAQKVKAECFDLELNHFGYFQKPKVLWMGLKQKPESLISLHKLLGESLGKCDYQVEKRDYAPHVTLMRKLSKPECLKNISAIHWHSNEFVLVESVSIDGGVCYKVRERYSLNN